MYNTPLRKLGRFGAGQNGFVYWQERRNEDSVVKNSKGKMPWYFYQSWIKGKLKCWEWVHQNSEIAFRSSEQGRRFHRKRLFDGWKEWERQDIMVALIKRKHSKMKSGCVKCVETRLWIPKKGGERKNKAIYFFGETEMVTYYFVTNFK